MQLYNRRLHLCDSGAKEINRKQQGSAERQMSSSSSWNRKWSETEKLGETNTMGRGTSKRVTQTSQGRNKRRIDWPCQSEAVNERERRRRRGGGRLLPSRQQGRKRREEVGFNQTLSRSVCSEWASPPGRSFTEGTLAAVHAGRGPSTQKTGTETKASPL